MSVSMMKYIKKLIQNKISTARKQVSFKVGSWCSWLVVFVLGEG